MFSLFWGLGFLGYFSSKEIILCFMEGVRSLLTPAYNYLTSPPHILFSSLEILGETSRHSV